MKFQPKVFNLDELIDKLKVACPDVESFISRDDLIKAQQSGELNERGLIVYIRKKAQDKVYVNIKDKSSEFVGDFFGKKEVPLGDLVTQLGSYIHNSFSNLIKIDDLAERIVRSYYTELRNGNLESLEEGVDDSRKEFEINMTSKFSACEKEINEFEKQSILNLKDIEDEDKDGQIKSIIADTAEELRKLNIEIINDEREFFG